MVYLVTPNKLPRVRFLSRLEQMKILKAAARELGQDIVKKFPQAKLLDAMVIGVALMEFPAIIEEKVELACNCRVAKDRHINLKLGCVSDPKEE